MIDGILIPLSMVRENPDVIPLIIFFGILAVVFWKAADQEDKIALEKQNSKIK